MASGSGGGVSSHGEPYNDQTCSHVVTPGGSDSVEPSPGGSNAVRVSSYIELFNCSRGLAAGLL